MIDNIEITTSRLILRPVRLEDFEFWAGLMGDPESMQFLGGPKSRYAAWLTFRAVAGGWYLDGISSFSVLEKPSGRWVGYAGAATPDGWPAPEVVFGIVRDRWGFGYATEATTAAVDWAFSRFAFSEVIYYIAPEHASSQRLARKLGATCRGSSRIPTLVSGEEFPVDLWGQTRDEWRSVRERAQASVG